MKDQLTKLKALAGKATPRWVLSEIDRGLISHEYSITTPSGGILARLTSYGHMQQDAEFIAACDPQTILKLIDRIEKLEGALDKIINGVYRPEVNTATSERALSGEGAE